MLKNLKDGIIRPGENAPFGFTSNLYEGWLWKLNDSIYISMIFSRKPRQGNFNRLIESILSSGYSVKVPTPLGLMKVIVKAKGFNRTIEPSDLGDVEVWVKSPKDK